MWLPCHREFSNSLMSSSSLSQNQYFICIIAQWVKSQKTFFYFIMSSKHYLMNGACFNVIKINLLLSKMMLKSRKKELLSTAIKCFVQHNDCGLIFLFRTLHVTITCIYFSVIKAFAFNIAIKVREIMISIRTSNNLMKFTFKMI